MIKKNKYKIIIQFNEFVSCSLIYWFLEFKKNKQILDLSFSIYKTYSSFLTDVEIL